MICRLTDIYISYDDFETIVGVSASKMPLVQILSKENGGNENRYIYLQKWLFQMSWMILNGLKG